jgi:dimethylhistidine N-methyltransferase
MRETHPLTPPLESDVDPQLAGDVQYSLTLNPRQLPSRYLYDALGSALFEAICELPWYRITRAEQRLLRMHAAEIADLARRPSRLVELGSGSAAKIAELIDHGWPSSPRLAVELVDLSAAALETARQRLATRAHVDVVTRLASYEQGLTDVAQSPDAHRRTLLLFLGSNIGNFDRPDSEMFLRNVRAVLAPGDGFLLGADLVKAEPELLEAYDDPLGVTGAFNRNLLVRLNRELGADFDLARFAHRAVWNPIASRVEMHLVSLARQRVRIPRAQVDLALEDGETIWTESSYKYEPEDVVARLAEAGFSPISQWRDDEARFALTLAAAA